MLEHPMLNKTHSACLRGAAILLVLLSHITSVLLPSGMARWFTPCGGIGVAVFLILSGYGLSFAYRSTLDHFWKKRIVGTLLPFILIFILALPLKQYATVWDFVLDILCIKPIGTTYFWYIGYLFLWYVIFYLYTRINICETVKIIALGLICIAMFLFFENLLAEQTFSFVIGCIWFRYKESIDKIAKKKWLLPILLAVGLGALALKQLDAVRLSHELILKSVQMLIKVPLALFVILAVYYLIKMPWLEAVLKFVGGYSYEVYLVHSVTILLFGCLTMNKLWILLIFIAATVVASALLHMLTVTLNKKILRR